MRGHMWLKKVASVLGPLGFKPSYVKVQLSRSFEYTLSMK